MRIRGLVDIDFSARHRVLELREGEIIENAPEAAARAAIHHGYAEPMDGPAATAQSESEDSVWPEGLSDQAIDGLEAAEIAPDDVDSRTDEEILAADHVGPASLSLLRETFGPFGDDGESEHEESDLEEPGSEDEDADEGDSESDDSEEDDADDEEA